VPGPRATGMLDRLASSPDKKAAFYAAIPLKRGGTLQEIADAIVFVASDKAAFITGQIIRAPRFVRRAGHEQRDRGFAAVPPAASDLSATLVVREFNGQVAPIAVVQPMVAGSSEADVSSTSFSGCRTAHPTR
jgi:hypothetical protein